MISGDISSQREVISEIVSSLVLFNDTVLLRFIRDQTFSIIFKSRLWGGQSKVVTPTSFKNVLIILALWHGALSCWRIKDCPISLSPELNALSFRTRKYWPWFIEPVTGTKSPSPFYATHPQNITEPPPWLTFWQTGRLFCLCTIGNLTNILFFEELYSKELSSVQRTLLQNSFGLWRCSFAKDSLLSLFAFVMYGTSLA